MVSDQWPVVSKGRGVVWRRVAAFGVCLLRGDSDVRMPDLAIGTEQVVGARAEKVATRKMSGQGDLLSHWDLYRAP